MYAFVLGKNKELSKEELSCYFETNNIKFKIINEGNDFLIIDTKIDPEIIKDLGGTLKIGKVTPLEDIRVEGIYGVSLYGVPSHTVFRVKKKIKENNKAKLFITRKDKLTAVEIVMKDLIGREVLVLRSKKIYYAITQSVYDPFEYKKLDVERPNQRGMLSIPIRLSKIMINLAKLKKGDTILDPFCGYGTILQSALLSGINVYGSDKDEDCTESAELNIEWLKEQYKIKAKHKFKTSDVLDLETEDKFDAIVTESYLGPPLRKSVTEERAQEIIDELNTFYEKALEKLSTVLKKGKRIIIILPVIRTRDKTFRMSIEPKDLKLIKKISDIHPKHITGREIFIFEK
ncbi:MAG: methyltransferase domain-containing protein [Candidatus Aenigmarchaeota archaeon]|nr:methyltransferase domain-containing protein [Candidatus Aenigmarchaeota archaeon]